MILRRLRNLWRLSAYKIEDGVARGILTKEFPTIEKRMATIVPMTVTDYFDGEDTE